MNGKLKKYLILHTKVLGYKKKIANPDYVKDEKLYKFADFGFVGVDVWQVKSGAIFDSIIITDDEAEVKKGTESWEALSKKEKELKKVEVDKAAEESKGAEGDEDIDTDEDDGADDEDL